MQYCGLRSGPTTAVDSQDLERVHRSPRLCFAATAWRIGRRIRGLKHPELFGNVLARAGLLARQRREQRGPEWLTQQIRMRPKAALQFSSTWWGARNEADTRWAYFYCANRHLNEALTSKGYPVRYVEGCRRQAMIQSTGARSFPMGSLFLAGKNAQSK